MASGSPVCALFPHCRHFDLGRESFVEIATTPPTPAALGQSWEHLGRHFHFPTHPVSRCFCLHRATTGGEILVIDESAYLRVGFQLGSWHA